MQLRAKALKARSELKRAIVGKVGDEIPAHLVGRKAVPSEAFRKEELAAIDASLQAARTIINWHGDRMRKWAVAPMPAHPSVGDMGHLADREVRVLAVHAEEAEISFNGDRCLYVGDTRGMVAGELHAFAIDNVLIAESVQTRLYGKSVFRELVVLKSDNLIGVAAEIRRLRGFK